MKITVSISDTITLALAKLADAAQKTLLMEAAGLAARKRAHPVKDAPR